MDTAPSRSTVQDAEMRDRTKLQINFETQFLPNQFIRCYDVVISRTIIIKSLNHVIKRNQLYLLPLGLSQLMAAIFLHLPVQNTFTEYH
jgi:hypothetical protein